MDIYAFLDSAGIEYVRHDHEPVFTCEESDKIKIDIAGENTKNIFLKDKKGKHHFLVVVPHEKRVNLKALKDVVGVNNLSLASSDRLHKYLGVTPGSVTILGLIHDTDHAVALIIDETIWNAERIQCHPLINSSTLEITHDGLVAFLQKTGHRYSVMDVPV